MLSWYCWYNNTAVFKYIQTISKKIIHYHTTMLVYPLFLSVMLLSRFRTDQQLLVFVLCWYIFHRSVTSSAPFMLGRPSHELFMSQNAWSWLHCSSEPDDGFSRCAVEMSLGDSCAAEYYTAFSVYRTLGTSVSHARSSLVADAAFEWNCKLYGYKVIMIAIESKSCNSLIGCFDLFSNLHICLLYYPVLIRLP